MTRSDAGRLGGRRMTRRKRAALARLHTARRGVRHNPEPDAEEMDALNQMWLRGYCSLRDLAYLVGVAPTTIMRWFRGVDFPNPESREKIKWVVAMRMKLARQSERRNAMVDAWDRQMVADQKRLGAREFRRRLERI